MQLIVVLEHGTAAAVGVRVTTLNDEVWLQHHAMEDRVAVVKPTRRQRGDRIHRAWGAIAEQHKGHIADVGDRDQPTAKPSLKCARGIGGSGLHHRHLPERIIGVLLDGDAIGAARDGVGQRATVRRTGGDGNGQGFASGNADVWQRINDGRSLGPTERQTASQQNPQVTTTLHNSEWANTCTDSTEINGVGAVCRESSRCSPPCESFVSRGFPRSRTFRPHIR